MRKSARIRELERQNEWKEKRLAWQQLKAAKCALLAQEFEKRKAEEAEKKEAERKLKFEKAEVKHADGQVQTLESGVVIVGEK